MERIPPPKGDSDGPLRALIFDSKYDPYKGVIAYVRVFDGSLPSRSNLKLMAKGTTGESLEVGAFSPKESPTKYLYTGEVGYIATGFKQVGDAPVGDTITTVNNGSIYPWETYHPTKPMVFAGLYPADGENYSDLRDALEKLAINLSLIHI